MAARDRFHWAVRRALEKEQWIVTDDPLKLEVGGTKFEIDLGAAKLLSATRGEEKIAVEIKSFLSDSPLTDYHAALGQFLNYRLALQKSEVERKLFLAIPLISHQLFFQKEFAQDSLAFYQVAQIIYDPDKEVITQWIP
ncbi:MAG: fatty-acid oxidation protein subunit alpha [Symploca sp. SIO2B6]|nr:fatty-acid oxidation protein subunit alpha [Symploca sp. SIO2B6]